MPGQSQPRPRRITPLRAADRSAAAASRRAAPQRRPRLTWTDFHGIQLLTSATAGPRHTRGGLAWGFTDTPRGAPLAAVNIGVRTAAGWGPTIFRPTITTQVTGPYARALLAADIHAHAQARRTPAAKPGQSTATEEAYRFRSYSPATATIDLVTSGPGANGNPVLVVTRLRVIWRHGDWRLVAPPAGNWAKASAEISSLAGYTIFPSAG